MLNGVEAPFDKLMVMISRTLNVVETRGNPRFDHVQRDRKYHVHHDRHFLPPLTLITVCFSLQHSIIYAGLHHGAYARFYQFILC